MTLAGRPPATRMELLRLRRRRALVKRGGELLLRRREALVRELFGHTRPAVDARAAIGHAAAGAYGALAEALAASGAEGLRPAGWPPRPLQVGIEPRAVWGLAVPEVTEPAMVRRSLAARELAPGSADPATLLAAERFEELVELLLAAASAEILIRRLGEALRRTTRQVHSLEERLAPALDRQVGRIEGVLEEREREDRVRLRRRKRC